MSVINDMLKDLDSRRGAGDTAVPVSGRPGPGRGRTIAGLSLLALALVLLVVALGARYRGWDVPGRALVAQPTSNDSSQVASGSASDDKPAGQAMEGVDDPPQAATDDGEPAAELAAQQEARGTASKPGSTEVTAPEAELVAINLEPRDGGIRLALRISGNAGSVAHEGKGASGELRIRNARLAGDLAVPSTAETPIRSLAVVPTDDGVALRYRVADEAEVRFVGAGEGSAGPALRIDTPSAASVTETPSQGDDSPQRNTERQGSPDGLPEPTTPTASENASRPAPTAPSADESPDASDAASMNPGGTSQDSESASTEPESTAADPAAPSGDGDDGRISRKRREPGAAEQAKVAYRKALEALRGGDRAAAQQALRRALEQDPGHAGARRALAMIHLRESRPDEAATVLSEGFDRGTRTPALISLYARSWLDRGNRERAIAIMEQGRETVAVNAEYRATLAALYQQQGRYEAAARAYQAALRRNGGVAAWWAGFGMALDNGGDGSRAVQAYQRALDQGGLSDSLASYVRQRLDALE